MDNIKNKFSEIDLFNFTSFFGLDFFLFFWPSVAYFTYYPELFRINPIHLEHPVLFFVIFVFRLPLEPSSQRFITHFEIGEPFEKEGMEFAVIKIKGQSFMLHQIRKMIGMTIAVVRGQCPMETIGEF